MGVSCVGGELPWPLGATRPTHLRPVVELHFTDAPWAVSRLPQVPPLAFSSPSDPSPRIAEGSGEEGGTGLSR